VGTMRRRVIGGVAGLLLAIVGAVLLSSYVGAADQRAQSGMRSMTVLVVTKPIAEGTSGDQLAGLVSPKELPAVAVPAGVVGNLSELAGQVATTDLQVGEQLLSSRFVDPATLRRAGEVAVPKGMQEVSIAVDPQRVVGGNVTAGSKIGLFVSLPKDETNPAQTSLMLDQVLVSRVNGNTTSSPSTLKSTAGTTTSTSSVLVTLAVSAADAEKVVFGAEFGTLWLSLEPAGAVVSGTRVVTRENVLSGKVGSE
jgi:pilus assembly protein CpaB